MLTNEQQIEAAQRGAAQAAYEAAIQAAQEVKA